LKKIIKIYVDVKLDKKDPVLGEMGELYFRILKEKFDKTSFVTKILKTIPQSMSELFLMYSLKHDRENYQINFRIPPRIQKSLAKCKKISITLREQKLLDQKN